MMRLSFNDYYVIKMHILKMSRFGYIDKNIEHVTFITEGLSVLSPFL